MPDVGGSTAVNELTGYRVSSRTLHPTSIVTCSFLERSAPVCANTGKEGEKEVESIYVSKFVAFYGSWGLKRLFVFVLLGTRVLRRHALSTAGDPGRT